MDGNIAGDGESTAIISLPETARFVAIAIRSGGGEEDHLKESDADLAESEGYKICRICQLSPELAESAAEEWEKIEIGCGCRGALGSAHRRCAEAWFRVKKNSCRRKGFLLLRKKF